MYLKHSHDSSDICQMGFIKSIQICEISHRTFGPIHRKYPMMCPMIFMKTVNFLLRINSLDNTNVCNFKCEFFKHIIMINFLSICWEVNTGLGNGLVLTGSKLHVLPVLTSTKFYDTILLARCKTDVTPLLTHWSYCSLELSHWYQGSERNII